MILPNPFQSRTAFRPSFFAVGISVALGVWIGSGCSTATLTPQEQNPWLEPPTYVRSPHPTGFDLSDLRALFTHADAPALDQLGECSKDLDRLKSFTQSKFEIEQGTRELVRLDPIRYHWCFYGKLLLLEDQLKKADYIHERQNQVLETYAFLTPMGQAFLKEYRDSRYMRWAVKHYRNLSEWVFYKKLDLTPQKTAELVEATNPFGFLKEELTMKPILEKYSIVKKPEPTLQTPPTLVAEGPTPAPEEPTPALPPMEPAPAVEDSAPLAAEPPTEVERTPASPDETPPAPILDTPAIASDPVPGG